MATATLQLAGGAASPSTSGPTWTPRREHASSAITPILALFAPTTLAEMDGVSLLNRVDTKYLLPEAALAAILPALASDYRVLDIDAQRSHHYRTLYFVAPDFECYRQHHAGRAARHKVRSRTYLDTGLSFFEIKTKNNKGRTVKHRLQTATPLTSLTYEARAFLAAHLPADQHAVEPKLWNEFVRITLVGKTGTERLTLDLGVRFDVDGRTAILPGVVIAELKQSGIDHTSAFVRHMHENRIRPTGVSKYCVGVAMLVPALKHNAFNPQLRVLDTIAKGAIDVR